MNKFKSSINYITKTKALKDLLMFAASLRRSPCAPVLPTFSDPAKSTKFMTESFSDLVFVSGLTKICLNSIKIMVCALDDV